MPEDKRLEKKTEYRSIYTPKLPSWYKRFAAWVVDIILVIVVATGIAFLTSALYNYDHYYSVYVEKQIEYGLYVEVSEDDTYDFEYEGNYYMLCTNVSSLSESEISERTSACLADKDFQESLGRVNYGPVIIVTTGIVASLLLFEFVLPLCLKHGRTIGMRFFDIGYVTDDDIDVKPKQIFTRFLFGKLIFNGLIPYAGVMYIIYQTGYGIVGIVLIAGVLIGNVLMLLLSKEKRTIPDYIAKVKPVDNTCQIYCESIEELMKKRNEEQYNTRHGLRY